MNAWTILGEWPAAALVARWTAVLSLAWVGNSLLVRRNPRWRVGLWRAAMVGLGTVWLLMLVPPLMTIPVPSGVTSVIAAAPSPPTLDLPAPAPDVVSTPAALLRDSGEATGTATVEPSVSGPRRIGQDLIVLWGVVAALLAARLGLSWRALDRIVRRSEDAPGDLVVVCRSVAVAIGSPDVRLVVSAEMATPCLGGLWRPVLVLPRLAMSEEDLRAALAHELAHARGRDAAWNLLAHLGTIVLWFHPLAWRLRAAHAAACDDVSDAVAADYLGDVPTYTRTLARLALAALTPPPTTGLAMARSSDVRRRIEALGREVFQAPLPRKAAAAATLAAGMLSLAIGSLAVTVAMPALVAPSPGDDAADADGRLEVQTVADATGEPVEGVEVSWNLYVNQQQSIRNSRSTDGEGRAVLEWPKGATVNRLWMTARKKGFVPYQVEWENSLYPVRLPASKVLRLAAGTPIGGLVRDDSGKALVGAVVTVYAPPVETKRSNFRIDIGETRTDERGRWRFDDAPADLADVRISVKANGLLSASGPVSRDLDAVTVLKGGYAVKGRVMDPKGKPIAGASVRGGEGWTDEPQPSKSDAHGDFVLKPFPAGPSVVTVEAEGYAPELRSVDPEGRPTLELRLEPARVVRGMVVDRRGKPVAGAMVAAEEWRRHRSLHFRVNTDKDGRFEWRGAPADAVAFSVGKSGFTYKRRLPITPSDADVVVTLDPELMISGRVTDAETGRPIPSFRAVPGLVFSNDHRVNWQVQDAAMFADGRYTLKQSEAYAGHAVRIEADGYKPAESRVFQTEAGAGTFDVALHHVEAADLLTGVVLCPDGEPAADAEVALATTDHPLVFENDRYRFGRGNGMSFAKAGPDGRFSFDRPRGPALLAAMSDDGYAEASPGGEAGAAILRLQAWGRVKGVARIGPRLAANQPITILRRVTRPGSSDGVPVFENIVVQTDARGLFLFDRVIPGTKTVARVVITEFGNGSSQHIGCWQEAVDVKPGQTVDVRIGGKGRPVVGRVVLKEPAGVHVEWRRNQPARLERRPSAAPFLNVHVRPDHELDRFAAGVDRDGRFRIEDVTPGHYSLTVPIDAPPELNHPGPSRQLGYATRPVDVPEGQDGTPIDLGEIPAEIKGG